MTVVAIVGRGAVAQACIRHLQATSGASRIVALAAGRSRGHPGLEPISIDELGAVTGPRVLVDARGGDRLTEVDAAIDAGFAVVSVADADARIRQLLTRDVVAREAGVPLVVGAGFAPGLADVLVAHATAAFDRVDDVRLARVGTAGAASRATVRRALRDDAHEWRRGAWRRVARTGTERIWFPPPLGARDCEAADVGTVPLQLGWPASTISSRLTEPARWWRRSTDEVGALRVEVWGERAGRRESVVLGAVAPLAEAAGQVAAIVALGLLTDRGVVDRGCTGAVGLGSLARPTPFLDEVTAAGIVVTVFEGV